MGRRTLIVIVSILIAAIGTGLVGMYVKGADQRAGIRAERQWRNGPKPAVTSTPTPTSRHGLENAFGITIEVDDADRAAGLLVPDDLISIFAATKDGNVLKKPVAENVRVISVGPKTAAEGGTGEQVPATVLGLDVSSDVARDIYEARAQGTLMVAVQGNPSSRPNP